MENVAAGCDQQRCFWKPLKSMAEKCRAFREWGIEM